MADEPARSVNTNYYSDAVIDRAFNLQEHIKDHGLEGIQYTEIAHARMEDDAESTTALQIEIALKQGGFDIG